MGPVARDPLVSEELARIFPRLAGPGFGVTSPRTPAYNCIAFAAGDDSRWWEPDEEPGHYWPEGAPREYTLTALLAALGTQGYQPCESGFHQEGFEELAVFTRPDGEPTHVARQLPDGGWTSKLGKLEDVRHQGVEDVSCPDYGTPTHFLRRRVAK